MSGPPAREPARRSYPPQGGAIPAGRLHLGRYVVRFATGRTDLEAVQRLRFEVFNRETRPGSRTVLG